MPLEALILAAVAVDLLIGDPRIAVHPVRLIGSVAEIAEKSTRRVAKNARVAGVLTAVLVPGTCIGAGWLLLYAGGLVGWWLHALLVVGLIYASIACMDLLKHALQVYKALQKNDLAKAQSKLGLMVGRDTSVLDNEGVVRATVESVAEGLVDGVISPLFYTLLFGPLGAVGCRAVNTMDSMFGYRCEKYRRFGWASARLDDAVNWLPARLTAFILWLPATVLRRIKPGDISGLIEQARRHNSPNAGWPESAMASALGIRLGGRTVYSEGEVNKPSLGRKNRAPTSHHILAANLYALFVLVVFTGAGITVRMAVIYGWSG